MFEMGGIIVKKTFFFCSITDKTEIIVDINLTSGLLTLFWRAASSKMSNSHFTGGGKF